MNCHFSCTGPLSILRGLNLFFSRFLTKLEVGSRSFAWQSLSWTFGVAGLDVAAFDSSWIDFYVTILLTSLLWPHDGDFWLSVSFRRAYSVRCKTDFPANDWSYRVLWGAENLAVVYSKILYFSFQACSSSLISLLCTTKQASGRT